VGAYFFRRIVIAIPVLLGITIVAFLVLAAAPGDPLLAHIDPEVAARLTVEQLAQMRHEAGLDQPVVVRYLIWLGGVLHGDFGYSLVSGRSIVDEVAPRVGPSLMLAGAAIVVTILVGIPAGVIAAINQYGKLDYILSASTIAVISTPTFVLGLVFLFVFGVSLHWLPVGEMFTFGKENDVVDRIAHLVMPGLILGLAQAAAVARYTRSSMLEVLGSEYITTARSKGLLRRVVLVRHGLRNALIPIITLLAIFLPNLVAQAVITETVFNWPGLGQLSVKAANDRDPALMMGIVLLIGVSVLVASIIADFAYAIADPRIRFDSAQ
jgi:peptide/nickel transport system permease protein